MLGAVFFALHSVHQDASFELSKTVFGQFFKFFIIKGVGGVQKLPNVEKKVEKIVIKKKFFNRGQNGTRKWVVEVLSSHVVLLGHSTGGLVGGPGEVKVERCCR